jgi:predicted DNA-binding antitoxin AbrB/MazE fold protein
VKPIHAIYANGVFRPTEPVHLPENSHVELECHLRDVPGGGLGEEKPATTAPEPPRRTIEEELMRIAAQVPKEEWDRLPQDLTDNLDHHLYGTEKK